MAVRGWRVWGPLTGLGRGCRRQMRYSRLHTVDGPVVDQLGVLAAMRKPYKGEHEIFDVDHLEAKEPFAQFRHWFDLACKTDGIIEANAMALSTATKDGRPSCRTVLMKGFDERGFCFFTNYYSRKGRELAENPFATLLFYWPPLDRSVIIEGSVERLSSEESSKYFHSRPKASQIGACVSHQSAKISGREVLTKRKKELEEKYADQDRLPMPDYWGGFLVRPERFEFWQGQTDRIHDRISFRKQSPGEEIDSNVTHQGDNGWLYERLAP